MTDSPMTEIGFGRVAAMFPVKDMERACAFYIGVLGFTKTFEHHLDVTHDMVVPLTSQLRDLAAAHGLGVVGGGYEVHFKSLLEWPLKGAVSVMPM